MMDSRADIVKYASADGGCWDHRCSVSSDKQSGMKVRVSGLGLGLGSGSGLGLGLVG